MMKIFFVASALLIQACSHTSTKSNPSTYTGLGKESVKPEVLQKYAPPALPDPIAAKVKKMLDIQTPGMGMLHPNGKQVFFTWRVTGQTQVWRVDSPKGFPVQMTGGKDATYISDITPDGKWLVLSRDEDGKENPGIFLQRPEGGALVPVFQKEKVRAFTQFISQDSKWLYFTANDIDPASNAIYRYNLTNQTTDLLFSEPGTWYIADYKKTGELLLIKLKGSKAYEFYEFNPSTKKLAPILGQNENEEYRVSYGAKPGEFIVLTPKFEDFARLYTYKNGKFSPITPPFNYEISGFSMDEQKTKILYHTNEKGYTRLHAMDARTYAKISLPTFKNAEHIYSGKFSRDGRHIMLGISYPQSPRSSFSYNFSTKKLTSWVTPSVPEIDLKTFVKAELEYYPSRDGVQIPMFVRRPPQCKDQVCPVIVHFHGGPEGQSLPGFSGILQMFVDEGFIVVEPNVRGSDGYGKKWIDADNAEKRLDVITDIEDCSRFIKTKWAKDGIVPKVGVMGGSYGGYSTLMAMSKFSGSYDAGVSMVGMSNLITFLQNTAPYRRHLRISEYGDPEKHKEALIKLSPITYLDQIKAPLMLIQGVNDPRVPAGEALQIHEALQSKNIPSRLILFADEGHGTQKKENITLEFGHTLQFFKEHLQ